MELVVLDSFDTAAEASLIVALLEANGIEAIIEHDEDVLVDPGLLANKGIGVKVLKSELEKAQTIVTNNQKAT